MTDTPLSRSQPPPPAPSPLRTLTLQHRIPTSWAADPWAEVRPLIDGADVLGEAHPAGLAPSCRNWRGPAGSWPLAVSDEPRRIMITEPDCTAGCCGALYVTVRREGDVVIWDAWENTGNTGSLPAAMRFEAAQYEAELARAAADRSWEEPLDTAARLLEEILVESRWFERWGCVLIGVWPRRGEPDVPEELTSPQCVDIMFHDPDAHAHESGERGTSYGYELLVTDGEPVAEQVRRCAERILADDPRNTAEIREA
ncbi:hypothetical protein [Streptomyces sp. NPDC056013]|uniref:hypothetical protein n=1 Tax=Streptomyces sp. NPDC056013 TaxID=3345680 RepID=UPI0035E1476E